MSNRSVSLNHSHDEKCLLKESSFQLTSLSTLLPSNRIFSLYPSILLLSKQKGGTYKTKEKIKIENVWISNGSSPEFSFIIGWPFSNYLVHFANSNEKEEWFNLLQNTINSRLKPNSTTITMSILVRGRKQSIRKRIENGKKAAEIMNEVQKELDLPQSSNYDLKIQIDDGNAKLFAGPENVYVVIMNELEKIGMRLSECQRSSLDSCPIVSIKLILSHQQSNRPSPHQMLTSLKRRLSRSETKSIFGRSLEGRTPPQPILSIIDHLRMHSYNVEGLFRKSPKQSTARELRSELERGIVPDYNKYNAHVLAATLKDYLRSIPNKLLLNGNYQIWMSDVVEESNAQKKLTATCNLLNLLPIAHSTLLSNLLKLLSKVSSSSESLMTSSSLAVCLAPSFLHCHDATSSKKVPDLITFLIENANEIIPFLSPSSLQISEVDMNCNDISWTSSSCQSPIQSPQITSPPPSFNESLLISSSSTPTLLISSSSTPSSPLVSYSSESSYIPSIDEPPHTTPIFRSKALRDSCTPIKKDTPRSPCLKRIHFNAHLLKGGNQFRPSIILSDSDSDNEEISSRSLVHSTIDVPRKTSLDSVRNDIVRNELLKKMEDKSKEEKDEIDDIHPPSIPIHAPIPEADIKSLRYRLSKGKDDKPTVQVLPFRAKEEEETEEEERECKMIRSLSQRTNEDRPRGDIHRTSSVIRDINRRVSTLKIDPIYTGLDSIEINWSVAQLKRRFQNTNRAPEIHTHFGE